MDYLNTLLPLNQNGGVPVVLFIVWYYTFTRSNKQLDDANSEARRLFSLAIAETRERYGDAIRHANELFRESSLRYEKLTQESNARQEKLIQEAALRNDKVMQELIALQKEEVKAKELLAGILSNIRSQLERAK